MRKFMHFERAPVRCFFFFFLESGVNPRSREKRKGPPEIDKSPATNNRITINPSECEPELMDKNIHPAPRSPGKGGKSLERLICFSAVALRNVGCRFSFPVQGTFPV